MSMMLVLIFFLFHYFRETCEVLIENRHPDLEGQKHGLHQWPQNPKRPAELRPENLIKLLVVDN